MASAAGSQHAAALLRVLDDAGGTNNATGALLEFAENMFLSRITAAAPVARAHRDTASGSVGGVCFESPPPGGFAEES